ncbi:FAD-dependent monooxygenase [Alicyclobacillus sendaiensis]|uniref:FAD-dependent monooxygenase n=1 Tax=Alicyclobacillus sendaiensis PA2 TaxID=3029425 RepID=A0ABT6XX31_ALISE|nr:FAD-dependent monooxygenase [Alicyclobacillus sendaiensis]MDI9259623.1 FAD-dependent monooxygenase [Alicyclobacillus sendaiensis PA2]
MKLGIVGAGVAGLAAALACARAGIAYDLMDRAAHPLEGGVALTLWPNALRALCDLGVDVRAEAGWVPMEEGDIVDMRGRTLYRLPLQWMEARFGFLPVCVRRAELLRRMHGAAGSPRIEIREVRRVVEIDRGVVVAWDGGRMEYHGVVLTDGIRGGARSSIVEARTRPTHYLAWRGIARGVDVGRRMREIWGRGFRFGYAAMGEGDVYWFATVNRSLLERAGDAAETWRTLGALAAEGPPEVARMMAATPMQAVYTHDIFDLAPGLPLAVGRMALLGDTAHAITPNLGFGGGLALEDGAALLQALALHRVAEEPERLAGALQTYAAVRRRRVARMAYVTRFMGDVMQWQGKAAGQARDALFRSLAPFGDRLVWRWMMGG